MAEIELEKKWNASDRTTDTIGIRVSAVIGNKVALRYSRNVKQQQQFYASYRQSLEELTSWLRYITKKAEREKVKDYCEQIRETSPNYTPASHAKLEVIEDSVGDIIAEQGILYHTPKTMRTEDMLI